MVISRAAVMLAIVAEALAVGVGAEWLAAAYTQKDAHAIALPALVICALVAYAVGIQRSTEPIDRHEELPVGERLRREAEERSEAIHEAESNESWVGVALRGVIFYVVVYGALRIQFAHDFALWDLAWTVDLVKHFDTVAGDGAQALFGAIFLIAIWVRSALRASNEIELEGITKDLSLPFSVVTVIIVLAAATSRSSEVARAGAAFYAVAVVTMACSQLALSGVTFGQLKAGGSTLTVLALTLAATAVVLLVAGVIFAFFGEPVGFVLGKTIQVVLTIILTPLAWFLEWFFGLIFHGTNPFENLSQNLRQQPQQAAEPSSKTSGFELFGVYALRIVALMAFIAFVWFIAVVAIRLRRRRLSGAAAADVKGVTGGLGEDLRHLLHSMVPGGRWRRKARSSAESPTVALYMDVVERAEAQGTHRGDGQTAAEFAPALASTFDSTVPVEITEAFQAARYGAHEADPEKLVRWRREMSPRR